MTKLLFVIAFFVATSLVFAVAMVFCAAALRRYVRGMKRLRALGYQRLVSVSGMRIDPAPGYRFFGVFDAIKDGRRVGITVLEREGTPHELEITEARTFRRRDTVSYSISIYSAEVHRLAAVHEELDQFEHPPLPVAFLDVFTTRISSYGYTLESDTGVSKEFMRQVNGCPITVNVFRTEVRFSIPYRPGSDVAILDARQDASELADSDDVVTFDPQLERWGGTT